MQKKVSRADGKLVFCNVHPEIMEVLEITSLNRTFKIVKDQEAALELFAFAKA